MKTLAYLASFLVFPTLTFLTGYWYSQTSSDKNPAAARKALYYVDPMNPGHRYDQPGIAPCGMQLEPVYSGKGDASSVTARMPPGTVQVSPEKQQLIGVRVEGVEKASAIHKIRALGRVAADETRIYRINASVDGWIRKAFPVSTGSLVKKGEPLAYFYAPEFLTAEQSYIYTVGSIGSHQANSQPTGLEGPLRTSQALSTMQQYQDSLRNLGMSEGQIEELGQTRKLTKDIVISSPAPGFILARNVSPGQRFDKGTELYRIADLSRVWILLDTYEDEAEHFKPGQLVVVRCRGKLFNARVSSVLPQFDPVTRTLKVRLEVDNPGYLLRPDMFVDVEHSVVMPSAITVPVDAVLDSGLKKTVFVERGGGLFEPRRVETGRPLGDRLEIVRGLSPGERIVVSGNFLIDSESRMNSAPAGISGTGSIDPCCNMIVDEGRSKAAGLISDYKRKSYFFCSKECKVRFDKAPQLHAQKSAEQASANLSPHHD